VTTTYQAIQIAGGDTAMPLNLRKRIDFMAGCCDLRSSRFLDCGCGAGEYVFALRDLFGTDAWGVEFSADKVRQAQRHPRHAVRIKQGNIEGLEEPDAAYDVILLNEVIEHVPDERAALREVFRVLKAGGCLLVFAPNRWFPFETHGVTVKSSGRKVPPYLPGVPYVPLVFGNRIFHYPARNYWPHELRQLIREAGFAIRRVGYFWQTFENISGSQPALVRIGRPVLRRLAAAGERIPVLKRFGASQIIVAQKPTRTARCTSDRS